MKWQRTPHGVMVPGMGLVSGEFGVRRNGGALRRYPNLVTDEGVAFLIDTYGVALSASPPPDLYVAPFGDDVTPLASWTAATFTSDAGEITGSTPEGYVETTRQQWAQYPVGVGVFDNFTFGYFPAVFNMRSATTIQVCGFGLLTDDTKGGTSGELVSAVRFPNAPAALDDHDILDVFYTLRVLRLP